MTAPRPLIAGNWKMNGLGSAVAQAREVAAALEARPTRARVAICAPATLVERLARAVEGTGLMIGGEDVDPERSGAFTGEISAEMLADAGARLVIVGHSERRSAHGETDALVARKALAAARGRLEPIICVGEGLAERDAGEAVAVVCGQVAASVPPALAGHAFAVAYEPLWAIGSGHVPTPSQIAQIHCAVRETMVRMMGQAGAGAPILYGGSVEPWNAAQILSVENVGGALVGGASLDAENFLQIVRAAV